MPVYYWFCHINMNQLGSSNNGTTKQLRPQLKSFAKQHHGIRKPHILTSFRRKASNSALRFSPRIRESPHQTIGICQRLPIKKPHSSNQNKTPKTFKTHSLTATPQCPGRAVPGWVHQVLVVVDQSSRDHDHCYTPKGLGRHGRCQQRRWESHEKNGYFNGEIWGIMERPRSKWLVFQQAMFKY